MGKQDRGKHLQKIESQFSLVLTLLPLSPFFQEPFKNGLAEIIICTLDWPLDSVIQVEIASYTWVYIYTDIY